MYLGIDFGTSFSQAATTQMGEPVLLLPGGMYGIPSNFYYDSETGILIGTEANDEGQGKNAVNLKREIKLELGTTFMADGYNFTSEDIVAAIYRYVAILAERTAAQKCIPHSDHVEGVVLAAPVNFNAQEIDLLRRACMRPKEDGGAGLYVRAIIKEPVAAALAYFRTPGEQNNNVLVFDLGGGTCDIALLAANRSTEEHYEVIDSDMIRVGGCKWDECLTDYLVSELEKQVGKNIRSNAGYMEKIRNIAVETKHSLSEVEIKNARVEIGGSVYKIPVSRQIFDEITKPLLDETIGLLTDIYSRNSARCQVHDIICVGGSSLMPQVQNAIRAALPTCEVHIFRPETAVAYGTAIYADMLKNNGNNAAAPLTDIASFSYGVRVFDDYERNPEYEIISNLITKGQQLPAFNVRTFNTIKAGGGDVIIRVYENIISKTTCEIFEAPTEPVGKLILILPENTPVSYNVHVNMMLNSSRLLEVEAFDDRGNRVQAKFQLNPIK